MTETDLINEVKRKRRELINIADKKQIMVFGKTKTGGNSGQQYLAILLLLFILFSAIAGILTYKLIRPSEPDIYYKETRITERPIVQKIYKNQTIENKLVIPEGDRETCIQLSNETFRRCFDE